MACKSRPASVSQLGRLNEKNRRKARTFAKQQKAAERIAAATTQLASGIAEASSAVEEIYRGAAQQTAAAEPASAAVAQIERGAGIAQARAQEALDEGTLITGQLQENRAAVDGLVTGVTRSLEVNRSFARG
ncbi:hypothetical protein MKK75_21290 [Methylobacterium sp. J-030]|uniref:hypothetical protein n=1 Tax=Methylobacterium sp. J-030 TaxID=2836627 RepID=UPI001FBAC09E|nr:hypothetical protein [Methylobacterium sp. J-030]MCJ2071296.1 hypothetical protein [Methylobacterium sp. J-030]